jgi:hypothetical protein
VLESVPMNVPAGSNSITRPVERAMFVGASLAFVTEIVKARSNDSPPASVVRTRTE